MHDVTANPEVLLSSGEPQLHLNGQCFTDYY